MNDQSKKISLALVTYNQDKFLLRFLENYLEHGFQSVALTVIDDGSTDETPVILKRMYGEAKILLQTLRHQSIAHSRNQALRASPTPWLAFSDTDCILNEAYFHSLLKIPDRFPLAPAVEGAICQPNGPKPPFSHSLSNQEGGMFPTANMVFHVSSILNLGGFDEAFENYREDVDLGLTLLERGSNVPFYSDLTVTHPYIPRSISKSLTDAWAKQSKIIDSEILLFQKHPHYYYRVRHHRDAASTLFSWCLKHTLPALRESISYLRSHPSEGLKNQPHRGFYHAAGILVSIWEQLCVTTLCMLQLNKISRLKSK